VRKINSHEGAAGGRANLATVKFNYLAWAARISRTRHIGATDLMVLVQLAVRYDPKFPKFTVSAELLANATNAGISTVRRSLKNLERLGDIETVARPGRSNAYRVLFDRAPPEWIKLKREKLARRRAKRAGEDAPEPERQALGDKKLAPGSTKNLAHSPPGTGKPPRQEVSTASISSRKHSDSRNSSFQHDREGSEVLNFDLGQDPAESLYAEFADLLEDNPDALPHNAVGRHQKTALPGQHEASREAFRKFVDTWPVADADEKVLWRTWLKYVVKGNADVQVVLAEARAWAKYYDRYPDAYVSLPGKWLAYTGWQFECAPKGKSRGT
jgi:hypothetical protein